MVHARHLHALLVATNLFWFQAIRQTVATLAVSMGQELGYSTKEKGWLIAAPSVGNIVTQLFGSHLERAIGARMTITLAVSGLAAGCLLVPVACSTSLSSGLLVLAAQGFVFGPMFPAHSVLLSRWTLPSERGWASAQGELAISIASMGAPLLVASLATAAGWRVGFYSVGTLCVLYVIFGWLRFGFSSPRECPYVSEAERALLSPSGTGDSVPAEKESKGSRSGAMDSSAGSAAPMHHVLLHPSILALFSCHMVYNLTTLSINSWMPSYYAEVLGLSPDEAKLHLTLPHLTAMLVKLGVSHIAGTIRDSFGASMLATRRTMCVLGYAGTAAPVLLLPLLTHSPAYLTTSCFCMALAGTGLHAEGFRANYLDVTRAHVGLVSGVGNCLSSVAAMFAPLIVGALVQGAGNWDPVWYCISAGCAMSAVIFAAFSSVTPVEEALAADAAGKAKKTQ